MLDRLDVKLRDNGELIPGKNHKKAGNALRWAKTEAPRPHHGNIFATKIPKNSCQPAPRPPGGGGGRAGAGGGAGGRVSRPRGRPRECVPRIGASPPSPFPTRARPLLPLLLFLLLPGFLPLVSPSRRSPIPLRRRGGGGGGGGGGGDRPS